MKLKDNVLKLLEENRGKSVSGAVIAEKLSVSRAAVWKAIEDLRKTGFDISAVTNKGYVLSASDSSLSAEGISTLLGKTAYDIHTEYSVTSTNTLLKELARQGEKAGYVLIANQQTHGKGRLGRSFYSMGETGLYMSVILRPKITIENALFITTSAAVAVARAIEALADVKAEIKWVNDIYIGGKKVCGILTESSVDFESGALEYAVLGIGVNLFPPKCGFPNEIKDIATTVFKDRSEENIRNKMAAEILRQLKALPDGYMSNEILSEYRQRSMLTGRRVYAITDNQKVPCTVLGIDDRARLLVRFENGKEKALSSGEVSIKL